MEIEDFVDSLDHILELLEDKEYSDGTKLLSALIEEIKSERN